MTDQSFDEFKPDENDKADSDIEFKPRGEELVRALNDGFGLEADKLERISESEGEPLVVGEKLTQRDLVPYQFGDLDLSLSVVHDKRTITIKIPLAHEGVLNHANSGMGYPAHFFSRFKKDAEMVVEGVKKLVLGRVGYQFHKHARMQGKINVTGPYTPQDSVVMQLDIGVPLDVNFDRTYEKIQRYLEEHRLNSDRDTFLRKYQAERDNPVIVKCLQSENVLDGLSVSAQFKPFEWNIELVDFIEKLSENGATTKEVEEFRDQILTEEQRALKNRITELSSDIDRYGIPYTEEDIVAFNRLKGERKQLELRLSEELSSERGDSEELVESPFISTPAVEEAKETLQRLYEYREPDSELERVNRFAAKFCDVADRVVNGLLKLEEVGEVREDLFLADPGSDSSKRLVLNDKYFGKLRISIDYTLDIFERNYRPVRFFVFGAEDGSTPLRFMELRLDESKDVWRLSLDVGAEKDQFQWLRKLVPARFKEALGETEYFFESLVYRAQYEGYNELVTTPLRILLEGTTALQYFIDGKKKPDDLNKLRSRLLEALQKRAKSLR